MDIQKADTESIADRCLFAAKSRCAGVRAALAGIAKTLSLRAECDVATLRVL